MYCFIINMKVKVFCSYTNEEIAFLLKLGTKSDSSSSDSEESSRIAIALIPREVLNA